MTRPDFLALAERCERASGPSRELENALFDAGLHLPDSVPAETWLSASLDAVLALAESKLPAIKAFAAGSPSSSGWKIGLYRGMTPTGQPHAFWEAMVRPHAGENQTKAATPALALLAATLRALAGQEELAAPPDTAG